MSTSVATDVPLGYEPRWRDVPALAWVAARAYAPAWLPGSALPGLTAACSMLVWLPVVVTMRSDRRVAALDRRAMVEVTSIGRQRPTSARLRPIWVGAAALLALLVVMTVAAILIADVALWTGLDKHAAMTAAMTAVIMPTAIGVVTLQPWRVIRSAPPLTRTVHALQSESPSTPIWRLGTLAAWPKGSGHGSALLEGLLRDWSRSGYIVCYPRNRAVEDWYVRLGMLCHLADGALYLDLRSGWPKD